jgi:CheY-like chemotaxis protein
MTAILGYLEIVHERLAEQGDRHNLDALETVRRNADHLLSLINDILDLSKIEAERMELVQVAVCLPELLEELRSVMSARAVSKGVALGVSLSRPVPELVLSDPTRLRQVLFNIVGNALKFTEQGRVTIAVDCGEPDAEGLVLLRIAVEDTGAGIPESQVGKLFRPFSQVDGSMSRSHGGTGLGLAISRRLARMLGGDITLEWSATGRGSRFLIELACLPQGEARVANIDDWARRRDGRRVQGLRGEQPELDARILLAEDGPDNQRLIAYHLRRAGAQVDIAGNGRIALEMLSIAANSGRGYELLLTDIQMPELDGYALVAQAREQGYQLPIVALTAHAMVEDRQRCLDAGCNDYATKPIQRKELIDTCAHWLSVARGERADPPGVAV